MILTRGDKRENLRQAQHLLDGARSGLLHGRYATYLRNVMEAATMLTALAQYDEGRGSFEDRDEPDEIDAGRAYEEQREEGAIA